jgi:topoisomerase IA-like protein
MPPRLPFQQGSQVEHDRFGLGSVVSINEDRITIRYDEHGEKTFLTSIAVTQLRKSDREPPSEKKTKRKTAASATSTTKKASKKKEAEDEAPQEE